MPVRINSDSLRKFANGQFEFKIGGSICRAVEVDGAEEFEIPPEFGSEFQKLIDELAQFRDKVESIDLDRRDVHMFLRKYFRMQAEISREVRRAVIAGLLSQPDDVARLPLEERLAKLFNKTLN